MRLSHAFFQTLRDAPADAELISHKLLARAGFTEIAPAPNQFRVTGQMSAEGTEPEATMSFFDSIAITNRGTYVPAPEVSRSLGSFTILDVPISLNVLAFLVAVAIAVFGYRAIKALSLIHISEPTRPY